MDGLFGLLGKKGSWIILLTIYREGKVSYTKLQEITKLNSRTLSRRLRELVNAGLVERFVYDDRTVSYSLTEEGMKLTEKLIKIVEDFGN